LIPKEAMGCVIVEDCIPAGYSVFTPGADARDVTYTTKGKVQA
jgi:hypothetical protein